MPPPSDAEIVLRWCRAGLDALAAAREEIDALNVYPVPDGDTGTNLFLTLESATAAAEEHAAGHGSGDLAGLADAVARGALLGARGNSGVIVAQMLRGVADVLGRPGTTLAGGRALADGLDRAAERAYEAVAAPVEGTILSVGRAAARAAAGRAAAPDTTLPAVALAAAAAAREALERTPEQLDVLRRAGVVDAGGRGLSVLLDAFDMVLTGRRPLPRPRTVGTHTVPAPPRPAAGDDAAADPGYEVMYLLDAPEPAVERLRGRLAELGGSLVVSGGGGQWHVHVHTAEAGAAVEAGIESGRPHRISVSWLGAQHRAPGACAGRVVVAFAAGDGLAELFAAAGAVVVATATGHRPSTGEMLAAVDRGDATRGGDATSGGDVVILPNERDAVPVAEAAAAELRAHGRRAAVIPTVAQVQGLAALAVHEPNRAFDADVVAMTAAAGQTRHGAVTVAAKQAVTMAGVCRPGDVLGVIDGDFAVIGADLLDVATEVVGRMLAAGGELVTVVTGDGATAGLADGVARAVRQGHPEADTVVYRGGQSRYPLLLGVE